MNQSRPKTLTSKRLFFAFEIHSPWMKEFPNGRLINENDRHLTMIFLGNTNWEKLENILEAVPTPKLNVGLTGIFDRVLFLPPKRANVCAFHAQWTDNTYDFDAYQFTLAQWLNTKGFPIQLHQSSFLPHVTICRRPFSKKEWEKAFTPLPFYLSNFHLYESLPGLHYRPIWTFPIHPPFDRTYAYGENEWQLALHREFAGMYSDQFPSLSENERPLPPGIFKAL